MFNMVKRLWEEEEGQGMAEYALILVLVAVALFAGFTFLRDGIEKTLTDVANKLGKSGTPTT